MTAEQFGRLIQIHAVDAGISALLKNLADPPGRYPPKESVALSEWYNALSEEDQAWLAFVVAKAARYTALGILCVLDGSRPVLDPSERGDFELYFRRGEECVRLNDPSDPPLHEYL